MADYIVKDTELTQIADAIRTKGSTSASLVFPSGFASAIDAIRGGTEVNVSVINNTVTVTGTDPVTFDQYLYGSLTTITHSTCTVIPPYKFFHFDSLSAVAFPQCSRVNMGAFSACGNLCVVDMPLCNSINQNGFNGCGFSTIYFSQVTYAYNAFPYCQSATDAYLPLATNIASAFYFCLNLQRAIMPVATEVTMAFANCYNLTEVSLPCATTISYTFYGCSELSSIELPAASCISGYAFWSCWKLLSLYLPGSNVVKLSTSTAAYNNPFSSTPIMGFTNYTNGTYGSIYVPASLVSAYKRSTNWVSISARITAIP